ncbi:unnamed protein product [Notodromas monacha]|uniref:Phosphatidylinositol-specific phospholipase C X domain-containing protein n=1 Tax=Notodromas monacha TaxID=399045 RepID=A0A7R9BQV6_9CRUS|nr:unnamed protein product [Notodromas monacha]CAG0919126.1 unnamed protein product [Notodromas monacha]
MDSRGELEEEVAVGGEDSTGTTSGLRSSLRFSTDVVDRDEAELLELIRAYLLVSVVTGTVTSMVCHLTGVAACSLDELLIYLERECFCALYFVTLSSVAVSGCCKKSRFPFHCPEMDFLDVRVKLSQQRNVTGGHVEGMPRPGQLEVYHGPMYQHLSFAQVLGEVANFLKSYPSETVLMKLNEELYTKEERGKPEFVKKLSDELKKYHDILWCCDYIPSMKDMRGKVVIIRNYKGEPYFGLSKDLFWVQNMWDIPTLWHLDKKKAAFKRLFDLSGSLGYLREPVINYASATGWAAHPHMVAARMNKYVLELISMECSPWKVGIVPMDFPGYGILHRIIDSNFCQDSKTPGPKHYGDCRAQWNMASFGCKVTRDRCAPGHSVQVKHFWKLWKCMCTCQDNAAMTDRGCGTIRENWCD